MNPELSKREEQVLECLCQGLSNKKIGKELDISESTVKTHLKRIAIKLRVANSRSKIAVQAVKLGYGQDLPDVSFDSLPPRRREVALCVAQGLESEQITKKTGIGLESVKTHIRLICRDLALPRNSRTLIAAVYIKSQLPKKP